MSYEAVAIVRVEENRHDLPSVSVQCPSGAGNARRIVNPTGQCELALLERLRVTRNPRVVPLTLRKKLWSGVAHLGVPDAHQAWRFRTMLLAILAEATRSTIGGEAGSTIHRHPPSHRHPLYVANCVANGADLGGLPWTPVEFASP